MNFLNKLIGVARGVEAQINPYDRGQTYKSIQDRASQPAPPRPTIAIPTIPRNLSDLPTQDAITGQIYGQRPGTSVFSHSANGAPYYDDSGALVPKWDSSAYLALPLRTNLQPMKPRPYL